MSKDEGNELGKEKMSEFARCVDYSAAMDALYNHFRTKDDKGVKQAAHKK